MENSQKLVQQYFKDKKQSPVLELSLSPQNEIQIYSHEGIYTVFAFGKLVKDNISEYREAYNIAYELSDYAWSVHNNDVAANVITTWINNMDNWR